VNDSLITNYDIGIIAMLFIVAMLGHIYIGTIGMEALGSGTVDVTWAKERHALWIEDAETPTHQSPTQLTVAPGE